MTRPRPPKSPWHQNCPRCSRSPLVPSARYLDVKISNHTRPKTIRCTGSGMVRHQCRAQAGRYRDLVAASDLHTYVGDRHLSAPGATLSALTRGFDPLDVISEAKRCRPHAVHPHRDLGVLESLKAVEPLKLGLAQNGVQPLGPQRRVSVADRLHEGAHRLVAPAEVPHVEHDAE